MNNITLFLFLLVAISFILFFVKIKKLKKANAGLTHVLEKSEESRITAERLKNKVLVIIDDLLDGIIVVDKDNKVSIINGKAEKLLDINKKYILNNSVLDLVHLSKFKKIFLPVQINSSGLHREEIELRKNFVIELTIEPLVFGKNDNARLVILRDITKAKLIQKDKNQFVSTVAHQLKSPLSAMRLSLKMLFSKDFGRISKEQRDVIEKTLKKNEALICLVEDLLEEAKNNESSEVNNKSLINLEDLTNLVVDSYKEEIKRKKINLKLRGMSGKLPNILVDQEKIKIVIQNLVDNAVKYTPAKGKIEIDITPKKEKIEFGIKDSGVGIPEEQQKKIFTRFSRAVNVAGMVGSGLGLAIAKNIVEEHHGKIWFVSKENKGSTFFFSLPITKEK